ncbi:uncharacterized protein LOC109822288 isoform X1 [Asparagus officinalis]|uniref:uncharacterized protein LOC109822288 isoform X1 n=2 Tax=Asparagus officinalis TaxID=4686 RepID=UPI00098E596B|nr:uncharacterized protein LOC109822288 isoform X1 [Asparagus officinalis]
MDTPTILSRDTTMNEDENKLIALDLEGEDHDLSTTSFFSQLLLNASRTSLQRTRKTLRMAEATEQPFRPREKLKQYQQIFQNTHKHTYLKGRFDKITSVAIPLALAGSALFLIGRGVYNMSHGIGKKE